MYKKIGIAIFALILIILPVITLLSLPDEKEPFSENENRYLNKFPDLSLSSVKDEKFMTGFDKWLSDRFTGREAWITIKNNTQSTLGRQEISTVFTNKNQMLQIISPYDDIGTSYSMDKLEKNIDVINSFAANHSDIPVYFMLCPTSVAAYGDEILTNTMKNVSVDEKAMIKDSYNSLENVTPVDITTALMEKSSEYIYYRTDHHWTSLGAFYAYEAAGKALGYEPYKLQDFHVETGSTTFQGTLFSKTLDQNVTKDTIDLYSLKNGGSFKLTSSNGIKTTEHESIFFKEYLNEKDKYCTYTGQNAAVVTITKEVPDTGKSILIIKDSYANSMMQFLANNYDTVTMLDMRYINQPVENLVEIDTYDQVLFLYNCITFAGDEDLIKLR